MKQLESVNLIEAIRNDIKQNLREELLAELKPEIERRVMGNIFNFRGATEYLKVSEATLRRMVKDGEVPFFRQRGNLFFRQTDLEAWISKRMEGA